MTDRERKLEEAAKYLAKWDHCWPGNINLEHAKRLAVAALATPSAPWQPPPEDQRPDGYRCLGKVLTNAGDRAIWVTVAWFKHGSFWDEDGRGCEVTPTAFAPLPDAPA